MKWRQNGTGKLAAVQGQVKVQPKADRRADKYRFWQNPTEVRFDQSKPASWLREIQTNAVRSYGSWYNRYM